MRIHIVQKGDTLWKIAQKYNVDFEELKQMNTQLANPDSIMPGMKIKIPTKSGTTIKKEMPIYQKEYPDLVHPFAEQPQPTMPVQKEQPKKEHPIKEIIKEVPKPIYTPKPPKHIMPDIDVNNYYLVNMANTANLSMQKQMAPHVPHMPPMPAVPIMPEKPKKEEQKYEEPPKEPIMEPKMPPPPVQMPYMMPQCCVPITPILPGTGYPCPPDMMMHPCSPHSDPCHFYPHSWQPGTGIMPSQMMPMGPYDSSYMGQPMDGDQDSDMMQPGSSYDTQMSPSGSGQSGDWDQWQPMSGSSQSGDGDQWQPMQQQGAYAQNPMMPMTMPMSYMPMAHDCGCGGKQTAISPQMIPMGYQTMYPDSSFQPMTGHHPYQQTMEQSQYPMYQPMSPMYSTSPYSMPTMPMQQMYVQEGQIQQMGQPYGSFSPATRYPMTEQWYTSPYYGGMWQPTPYHLDPLSEMDDPDDN